MITSRSGSQAGFHVAKRLDDLPVADVHEVDAADRVFLAVAEPEAPADRCPVARDEDILGLK